ncbi:hypothetical protein QOT17_001496 [Balamuthia mandrillaris]
MHPSVFFLAPAAASAPTSPPSRPHTLAQSMRHPPQPHQPSSCSLPYSSSPQSSFAFFNGEETPSFHYFQDQQQPHQTRMPLGQHVPPQNHHPSHLSHPPPWRSTDGRDTGQRPLLNKENNAEIFNPAVEELCSNLIPPPPTASLSSQTHPHLPSPSFPHPQPHPASSYPSSHTSICGHPQAPCPPQLQRRREREEPKRKSNEGEEDDDSHSPPKRRAFRLETTERRDGRRLSEQEEEAGDDQASFSTSGSSSSSFLKSSTTPTTKRSSPQRQQSSPAASLPPFPSTPTNNSQRPARSSSRKNVDGGQVSAKEGRGVRTTTKKAGQRTKRSTAGTHPSSSSTPTMTMFEIERQRQAALRRKKGMRAKKRFLKQGPNELDFRLDQHPPPAPSSLPPTSSPLSASGPAGRTNSSSSSDSSPPLRRASSFPFEQQQQQRIASKAKTEGWMGEVKQQEEAGALEAAEQPFYFHGGRNRMESSVGTPTCPPTTVDNSLFPSTPSPAVYAAPDQPQTVYSVHPLGSGFPVASGGRRPQPTVAPQQPSQRQQQLHQLANVSKQRRCSPPWR